MYENISIFQLQKRIVSTKLLAEILYFQKLRNSNILADLQKLSTTSSEIAKILIFYFEKYWTRRQVKCFENIDFLKMCPIFASTVDNLVGLTMK